MFWGAVPFGVAAVTGFATTQLVWGHLAPEPAQLTSTAAFGMAGSLAIAVLYVSAQLPDREAFEDGFFAIVPSLVAVLALAMLLVGGGWVWRTVNTPAQAPARRSLPVVVTGHEVATRPSPALRARVEAWRGIVGRTPRPSDDAEVRRWAASLASSIAATADCTDPDCEAYDGLLWALFDAQEEVEDDELDLLLHIDVGAPFRRYATHLLSPEALQHLGARPTFDHEPERLAALELDALWSEICTADIDTPMQALHALVILQSYRDDLAGLPHSDRPWRWVDPSSVEAGIRCE